MKLRRALLLIVAAALVVAAAPARAATDTPYWRVKTNLPVETIKGAWSVADSGRSATLEFQGVNVVGQATIFTAGWRTGWFEGSQPETGEFTYLVDATARGELRPMVRLQAKGGRWSPWFGGRMRMRDGGGTYMWGGGAWAMGAGPVRYEWKMVGTIEGNAYVEGSATITLE